MASPVRPRRDASAIPAYFLYGEGLQPPNERLIHVETIAARSRLHDWTIRPHRHRDLQQILLLRHGRVVASLDGRTQGYSAPLLLVIPPTTVHSFRFQRETVGLVISVAPRLIAELLGASPGLVAHFQAPRASPLQRKVIVETDLWALGEMLLREFARSAPGRHTALRGYLGALLANVGRLSGEAACVVGTAGSASNELVARFRCELEQHFCSHLQIDAYAQLLGVTEKRLRTTCLRATGQTPAQLVHLRLIVEAERQLRYTSMPIAQVAFYLGFDDPAYFSRFFTQRMGVSPRAFRLQDGLATLAADST
jgi:AraC family transcriptional regulator, transcriptional activator of pobA